MTTPAPTGPPARSRGVIALAEDKCTVCMICVRECPDWCITVEGHTEYVGDAPGAATDGTAGTGGTDGVAAAGGGRRPRTTTVLDRFAIDFGLCMYCGICIETCPFDALSFTPAYAYDAMGPTELIAERDGLAGWLATVEPAPALAEGAEPVVTTRRRGSRA